MTLNQSDVDEAVEKSVATREPHEMTAYTEPQGMTGEADPSDFVLPFAKLLQKTSPETNEGHAAGLFLKSNGEESDTLEFVVLHIARGRTFYDGDNSKLLCSSTDRRTGNMSIVLANDLGIEEGRQQCNICPHFNDDQFTKLACKLDFTLTCYDLRAGEPFLYRVRGSSQGMFKYRLISAVAMGNKPPWFAAFEMTAALKTNEKKQSWFAPEMKPIQQYTEDERREWQAYAEKLARPEIVDDTHMVDPDDLPFE